MKLPLFFYANLACKYQNYLSFLQTHCIMDLLKNASKEQEKYMKRVKTWQSVTINYGNYSSTKT